MSSLAIQKLDTLLQDQVYKQDKAGASGSSDAVIEAVRREHPAAIRAASIELENDSMRRRLSRLGARRPNKETAEEGEPGEPDMFAGYPGVRPFMRVQIKRDDKTGPEWKPLENITLGEFGAWLAEDRRTETTRRQREPGMAKLFRDLSEVAKGRKDITVRDAMKLRRARGG